MRAVLLALLLGALVGCFGNKLERSTSALVQQPTHLEPGPTGADVVLLQIAVLERPYGDRFLNTELWQLGDEQGVALERKPVLQDNGFRVCQIVGGLPPGGLHALIMSPRSNVDPRQVRTRAGTPVPVALGPARARCSFRLCDGGRDTEVTLAKAHCLFEVVPTLADEGRVTLRFTPHVQHGDAQPVTRAVGKWAEGPLDWKKEVVQPEEAYPDLGWELTVGPSEYVVVGTRLDRPDTLGQRCFLPEGSPRRQRLLVLRTARAAPGMPADESLNRAPPLALQAGWPAARGSAE
jgi:hypothetical protein